MQQFTQLIRLAFLAPLLLLTTCFTQGNYKNFKVAIYSRVYEVQEMKDLEALKKKFEIMQRDIKPDKIYLETHRDMVVAGEETVTKAKQFFESRGLETAGGITLTVSERNRFETYCYTNPEHRQKLKELIEYTAGIFDEVILDDFFFTNCKCESCIKAKGEQSWTDFRIDLLANAARELVVNPAKAVNPDVVVIVKYPNWYEHFQGLGFNLEAQPKIFDKLYTGTETRDPVLSQQHLQQYLSYNIFRYFENLKPGANAGGWVDTGGSFRLDRYAEQLWLTLFAKAPEITLFDFRQMQRPIQASMRGDWQGQGTSFDFDEMITPVRKADGTYAQGTTIALAAGYALKQVDDALSYLGTPIGIKSYKPYHSTGEDFLHNYLGMVGIPIDLLPEFPADANTILLTESAKFDPSIVEKIEGQLVAGKTVVITSGLLRALQGKGIEDIVELEYTNRKALIKDFVVGWGAPAQSKEEMLIPQIQYLTNDSWEEVSSLDAGIGWPIFHSAKYASGMLYVITIPENFGDIYNLPPEVVKRIKRTVMQDMYVRVDGPNKISLFVYDNNTFIVHSFLDESADIDIVIDPKFTKLTDLLSDQDLVKEEAQAQGRQWWRMSENKTIYKTQIKPHSYRVLRCE
jgi:hypothetical protein